EVRGEVAKHISNNWSDVKSRYVSDVMEHVRAKAMLPSAIEQPAWLGDAPHGWAAEDCLATRDAIVHLPSLAAQREPAIIAASPSLWTTTATEFAIDLQAPRPESWLRFLDDLWGNDAESIQLLQEWFGYCLTSDTRQHKMLLVVGPPRSGKGTVGRVLTALVGKGNVAAPTLGGLSTNFGLWPLIDKGLAIISDARLSRRADQDPVVERLLSITGEDSITVDRKNLAPLTLRLPTRFMIMSNELPRLSDASAAVVSRFLVLRTATSWLGREDHELESRLLAELPGILSWAIEGWRRLRERGPFCQPASGAEAGGTMNDLASPVGAFVRECCSVEVGLRVAKQVLFEAWQQWCGQHGRGMSAGSLETFSRDLFAAAPGVRSARHRVGGRRINFFSNITLRTSSR
ncbi:MAG TPA: phage/plasmid primase, P4 family, partial [Lacipirellulaceae bacterium]|nr:phage/plasmid primase, P4 family [Lacipirellulaceae bacterium]